MKMENLNIEELSDKLVAEIDGLAVAMSKSIEDVEGRVGEIENEHKILTNHYATLSNRVNYLEKKVLKR